jgi:hypothetical protein
MSNSTTNALDLRTVKQWAKAQEKQLKQLRKTVDKADDIALALRQLDVSEPTLRSLRNKARKLNREFPTAARFRQKLLREIDSEVKRFGKMQALI